MDGWSLEEIRARHWSRPLAETQNNPVLARRVEYYVASLEGDLRELRCRRYRRGAVAYLAGYANGALYTMFDPDAELDNCGHTTAAIRLAAACRLAA
jgi:hypothetical protein